MRGALLPIEAQQSQPLLEHPPQEEGIADEGAPPEAAGGNDETPNHSVSWSVVQQPNPLASCPLPG